jgi:NMD protein affecting ribosome stability and mRNA decay
VTGPLLGAQRRHRGPIRPELSIHGATTLREVFCHNCGHRNPSGVNFCSSCGTALRHDVSETTVTLQPVDEFGESPDEDPTVTLVEVPRGQGVLVVKRGPNVGARFPLDKPVIKAGRHPDSDIFLDDITVSRRHAELVRREDGSVVIRDDGSLNGTYVNRERIDEQVLTRGDEVQIGKFKLVYLVAGDE